MRAGKRKGSPDSIPALPFPGDSGAVRTRDPQLRRLLLYPTELMTHTVLIDISNSDKSLRYIGAGDGNRTHMTSLEGWSSTTELHPHTA